MKIYILRHEERPSDCSFFTPLTKNGLKNAKKLVKIIENKNIKIDEVYCSPFIRTLQTISPFIITNKLKINLEYGLSEIHHPDCITHKAVGLKLPDYIAESFNYNESYNSIIKHNEIKFPENINDVNIRINKILKFLISKYINKDINILIVTHQSLCTSALKNILNSKYIKPDIKKLLNKSDELNNYNTGKMCLIFNNNEWTFENVN